MITRRTRIVAAGAVLAAAALLSGCGSNDDGTEPGAGGTATSSTPLASNTEEPTMDDAQVEQLAASVVGMSEDDAVKAITDAGCTSRVVERDGEKFPVTMDLNPMRVNLTITDSKVTKATVG